MPTYRSLSKLVLCVTFAVACKSKSESAPAVTVVPSASGAPTAASAPPAASAALPARSLAEADVKSLVQRWEAAQNSRDFAAYSALYAERFMGVKRVGEYSKRFDRKGWLEDRKPMFDGGAQVRVTGLEVVAAGGATRASFTQEFTSKGFRDVGKKELFLVAAPGGIAITREEMLSSEVSKNDAASESVLAYHRDGVVVQRGFDKSKLTGAARLLSAPNASPIDIALSVEPAALSEGARAWLGRDVTAYTTTGEACSSRVARFEVRVRAVPHFGMRQAWNGELDEPKASSEGIASAVARMAQSEEYFVVGVLERSCAGSWATAAAQAFVKAEPVQGPLREAALTAFRALPAYAEQQRKFVKEAGDAKNAWESVNGELSVVTVRAPGQPQLLLVAARTNGGCAGFNASLSAFWQVSGTGAPKLDAVAPTFGEYVTLRGALEPGATQGLALLAGPDNYDDQLTVLRLGPKATRRVVFATSFWDCDC